MRRCGVLAACVTCFGCTTYHPTISHPMSHAVRPEESALECGQLDDAILKADTVRWVIRDDGGTLESSGQRAVRYGANALFAVPLSLILHGPAYVHEPGSGVLDAADHRIVGLLQLKRDKGCPPAPTDEPGMTDLQMLEVLEPLTSGQGDLDREALDQRTTLLDHLRASPPIPPKPAQPRREQPDPETQEP
ncbi:MAG: hypothetical protein FIB04_03030 [Gammaproteobacteria bacterium]|nr:hypothetical protein [Gammaproteobacteria bacterium]